MNNHPVYQPRRTLLAIVADRLAERRTFTHTSGWLWSLYDRALNRKPGLKLWRSALRRVGVRGHDRPFFLRLGSSDWLVLKEIFVDGEYDALKELDPASIRTILDLGANIGLSVRLWQNMFPGAHIVAVEPDAGNVAVCRANSCASPLAGPPPILHQCCVAGSRKTVALDHSRGEWGFRMRDADGQSDTVDALTVPDIISRSGITGQIDLLKCDIEGAEAELFENAADWLGRVGTMVVELHAPYSEAQFLADLDRTASDMWDCRTLAATKDFTVVLAHRRTLAPQVVGPGRRAEISAAPL